MGNLAYSIVSETNPLGLIDFESYASFVSSDQLEDYPTFGYIDANLDGKENTSNRGIANGYSTLGSDAKIPTSQLPAAVLGGMNYQGTWDASANSPAIPTAATGNKGWFYIVATAGATSISGITDWKVGDWIVSGGATWSKVDNTDAIFSVAGLTGTISQASLQTALGLGTAAYATVGTASGNVPTLGTGGSLTLLSTLSASNNITASVGGNGSVRMAVAGSPALELYDNSSNKRFEIICYNPGSTILMQNSGTWPVVMNAKSIGLNGVPTAGASCVSLGGTAIATNASGVVTVASIGITDATTGTGGITALTINLAGTGTGSGVKLLADLQTAGTTKWRVDTNGNTTQAGTLAVTGAATFGGTVAMGAGSMMSGSTIQTRADTLAANVKTYGAAGDGTANDTAAIVAAFTAANASGGSGRVYFPKGTYLTDTIIPPSGGMEIYGAGIKSIIKSRTGGHVFELTGSTVDFSYTTIRDLQIVGAGQTGNTGHGLYAHDCIDAIRHLIVSNVRIEQCGGDALRLGVPGSVSGPNTVYSSKVIDCHAADCGGDLFMGSSLGPIFLFDNCYHERPLAGKWGLRVERGETLHIRNHNGQDNINGTQGGWGRFDQGQHNTIIENCNIEGWSGVGIQLGDNNSMFLLKNIHFQGPVGSANTATAILFSSPFNETPILINCKFDAGSWLNNYPLHCNGQAPPKVLKVGGHTAVGHIWSRLDSLALPLGSIDAQYADGLMSPKITSGAITVRDPLTTPTGKVYYRPAWYDGTYSVGDRIEYPAPVAGGYIGEVCTSAGTITLGVVGGGFAAKPYGPITGGSVGTISDPRAIAGLAAWHKWDDTSTLAINTDGTGGPPAENGQIKRVADKSGRGNHAVMGSATGANYHASLLNSRGGATFSGTQYYTTGVTNPQAVTLFFVFSSYASGSLYGSTTGAGPLQRATSIWSDANNNDIAVSTLTTKNRLILRFDYINDRFEVWVNGVYAGVNTQNGVASTLINLGVGYTEKLSGNLNEDGWFDRYISDADLMSLDAYLKYTWGL